MESEGVPRHPKRSKPLNAAQFSSIPSEDTVLPMPNIPEELITEILSNLPAKSLLKFRCVSKSWLSLISSPEFVKTHLLLSASNKDYTHHGVMFKFADASDHGVKDCSLSALLYHAVSEVFDLDYPGKNPDDYPWLVGSVNGLICLAIHHTNGLYDLFIWNPSIRKCKKLPNCELNLIPDLEVPDGFKFGFAYDKLHDDYKVVGIFAIYRYSLLCRFEVKIYSLRSNSWRRISDFPGRDFLHVPGKVVNERLHWLEKGWKIVSFDLATEKWAEIERPCDFKGCHLMLGVLGSDLSVLCNTLCHDNVWVMKEYGVKESWTKMFTIKSPIYFTSYICHPPIFVSNEGDFLLKIGTHFTKYNPKEDSIRYLHVTNFASYIEAEIYVKSLVWPF